MRKLETVRSNPGETLRSLGSSVINFKEIRQKLRVRALLSKLAKRQLDLDKCVELFSLAGLGDWYGPDKKKAVRQPWAVLFGDLFVLAGEETKQETISRLSELSSRKQANFLDQLFELDPPQGERDDGNWRQLLAQALWQRLDEVEQTEFISVIRASSAIPSKIKESFGIFPQPKEEPLRSESLP